MVNPVESNRLMHRWCRIGICLLLLLQTIAAGKDDCEITNQELEARNINPTKTNKTTIKKGATYKLTCQDGYGLILVPADPKNFKWPTPGNVPDTLLAKCEGKGTLEFKHNSKDCTDKTCDGLCKKHYSKKDIQNLGIEMDVNFGILDRDLFWTGEIMHAECNQGFRRPDPTKDADGKFGYHESKLDLQLMECKSFDNCGNAVSNSTWKQENKCMVPLCDVKYASKLLHAKFEPSKYLGRNSQMHNYTCNDQMMLEDGSTTGQVMCYFDEKKLQTFWVDIKDKTRQFQCQTYCFLNHPDLEATLHIASYELMPHPNVTTVRRGDKINVKCKKPYHHDGETEQEIHAPFDVLCSQMVNATGGPFQVTKTCQDGECTFPPDHKRFNLTATENKRTGLFQCRKTYENNMLNNTYSVYLICYDNYWYPAKLPNGQLGQCIKPYVPKDCSVDWKTHGIDMKGLWISHLEKKETVSCYKGFVSEKDTLTISDVVCKDGVLYDADGDEAKCHPRKCKGGFPKDRHVIFEQGKPNAITMKVHCELGFGVAGDPFVVEVWVFCLDGNNNWDGGCQPSKCLEKPDPSVFNLFADWPPPTDDVGTFSKTRSFYGTKLINHDLNKQTTTGIFCCKENYGRNSSAKHSYSVAKASGLPNMQNDYNFALKCIALLCIKGVWRRHTKNDVCVDLTKTTMCNLKGGDAQSSLTTRFDASSKAVDAKLVCKPGYKPDHDDFELSCNTQTRRYYSKKCMSERAASATDFSLCISKGCLPNECKDFPPNDGGMIVTYDTQPKTTGYFECQEGYTHMDIDHLAHEKGAYAICLPDGTWKFKKSCYKKCPTIGKTDLILKEVKSVGHFGQVHVDPTYCAKGYLPQDSHDGWAEYRCIRGELLSAFTKKVTQDSLCVKILCGDKEYKKGNSLATDTYGIHKCMAGFGPPITAEANDTINVVCIEKGATNVWDSLTEEDICHPLCKTVVNATTIVNGKKSEDTAVYRQLQTAYAYCNPPDGACDYSLLFSKGSKSHVEIICVDGRFQYIFSAGILVDAICECIKSDRPAGTCLGEPDYALFHVITEDGLPADTPTMITRKCNTKNGYYPADSARPNIIFKCFSHQWGLEDPSNKCVAGCVSFPNDETKYNLDAYENKTYFHEAEYTIQCKPGYSIFNTHQTGKVICNDGIWVLDGRDVSNDPCQAGVCDAFPNEDEFHVMNDSKLTGSFKCDKSKYAPKHGTGSNSIILLCINNKWSHTSDDDKCFKRCESTVDLLVPNAEDIRHGQLIHVECRKNNTVPKGGSLARCNNGQLMHVADENQDISQDKSPKECTDKPLEPVIPTIPATEPPETTTVAVVKPTEPPPEKEEVKKGFFDNSWAIPVIVVCVLLVVIIIVVVVVILVRRRNKDKEAEDDEAPVDEDGPAPQQPGQKVDDTFASTDSDAGKKIPTVSNTVTMDQETVPDNVQPVIQNDGSKDKGGGDLYENFADK